VIALALVWLRAAGLVGQAAALGGTVFALVVLRERTPASDRARARILALAAVGALVTAGAQVAALVLLAATFADDAGWALEGLLGSTVGAVGLLRVAAAIAGASAALALRREPDSRMRAVLLPVAILLLPLTGALVSHGTGRVDGGAWLVILGALHQAAAGSWVGGLVSATLLVLRSNLDPSGVWLRPFSAIAAWAVAALALTGIALGLEYVGTAGAAIGTSYGTMVLSKSVLFLALLAMGLLNHRALHGGLRWPWRASPSFRGEARPSIAWRRRLEVEAGLAVVTVFLAASISSAPPAVDVVEQRATPAEVRTIFTPRWPRLASPSLAELAAASALADPDHPRQPENTAWSEFGHNVAGLFILTMGVLATLERTGRAPWARHWPLLIVALTGFVAWSLDPEGWQTGLVGFWEHLLSPEVLQHRILLGLTALFGVAEWRVRSGRRPDSAWRYVFPVVCVLSGAFLLSHSHDVSNLKSAFLMEVTHLPLGLVILVAGWSRWLELRLPSTEGLRAGRLWGPALAVFGLLLVLYREG
jgi:putative copper resistance protein D